MRLAAAALVLVGCSFDRHGLPAVPGAPDGAVDVLVAPPDAAPDAAPDANLCPPSYAPISGGSARSLYRIGAATAMWDAAEADCEADGLAHLVVLDDDSERDAIRGALDGDLWTGVTDQVSEGTYFKVTTGLATYLPWLDGEPNNQGGEDCVELKGGGLNDDGCSHKDVYVCECDGLAANPVAYTPP
jgi:Lectin C-type domain